MLQAKKYDFSKARKNMLDCQILTNGVTDPAIQNAFATVPRELFVPEHFETVAYNDEDVPVGQGRFLIEPMVHAKILQALNPKPHHVALDIGCGSGYSSAILSTLVTTIVAIDNNQELLERADYNWRHLDACNIASYIGPLENGQADAAPYDLIIFNGAISQVPEMVKSQLAENGKMIAILKDEKSPMAKVTLIENLGNSQYSSYTLFSAGTPYLDGFVAPPSFNF
ncbi:MAG: protein-L-isoaspartate O-methyltransferase [Micavibrio sp.]|nr:protein-L-isoaspartate O-methyltransferase [Micavibrio sp.]